MRYIVSGLLAGLGLTRALNKLSICLRHAAALGLDVDLQATDKARALLGKQRHPSLLLDVFERSKTPKSDGIAAGHCLASRLGNKAAPFIVRPATD